MKNVLIVFLLAAVVFLCAAKRQPALTINGVEVHELRVNAPLESICYGQGLCSINYAPQP